MKYITLTIALLSFCSSFAQKDRWYHLGEDEIKNSEDVYKVMIEGTNIKIPDDINTYNNLEILWVRGYKFTDDDPLGVNDIPESLKELRNLRKLILSNNSLKIIPDFIGELRMLDELFITEHNITELPDLSSLKNLKRLNISCKNISSIPLWVFDLPKLEELTFSGSAGVKTFNASIGYKADITILPNEIGNLKMLKELDISFTNISSLPNSIVNCDSLTRINIIESEISELEPVLFDLATRTNRNIYIQYSKSKITHEKSKKYLKDNDGGDADVFLVNKVKRIGPKKSMWAMILPNYEW